MKPSFLWSRLFSRSRHLQRPRSVDLITGCRTLTPGREKLKCVRNIRYFHSSALSCKQHLERICCFTKLGGHDLYSLRAIHRKGSFASGPSWWLFPSPSPVADRSHHRKPRSGPVWKWPHRFISDCDQIFLFLLRWKVESINYAYSIAVVVETFKGLCLLQFAWRMQSILEPPVWRPWLSVSQSSFFALSYRLPFGNAL